MTMLTRMTTRKHMDTSTRMRKRMLTTLCMTMLTQLRRLPRLRRYMTIMKRMAMTIPLPIPPHLPTHEQPEPDCCHRAAHGGGPRY